MPRVDLIISQWQFRLSDSEKEGISGGRGGGTSEVEIKATLWSLKLFKASGPDGLHAGFFQKFWHTVGNYVIEEV